MISECALSLVGREVYILKCVLILKTHFFFVNFLSQHCSDRSNGGGKRH